MTDVERGHVTVVKKAPYTDFFQLPSLEDQAVLQRLEPGWKRWALTRELNPFIKQQGATGFEGYFVGRHLSPQEVGYEIASLGHSTLEAIHRYNHHKPGYMKKVWRVAKWEVEGMKPVEIIDVLQELNTELVGIMARLSMNILPQINREGADFHARVAGMVDPHPISYGGSNGLVQHHEMVMPIKKHQEGAIMMDDTEFSLDTLREGYMFMQYLGRAGYPLLRLALQRR